MDSEAFENVKNQVGFCGIWCGSCIVGNGMLKELTKRYEHLIDGYGVDKWGATDFDGKEFIEGLSLIQKLPVCKGCRKGGGNESCGIRPCALSKKLPDCIECGKMKTCGNREAIRRVREGAFRVGMLGKAEESHSDHQQLTEKWTAQIRTKCLTCGA